MPLARCHGPLFAPCNAPKVIVLAVYALGMLVGLAYLLRSQKSGATDISLSGLDQPHDWWSTGRFAKSNFGEVISMRGTTQQSPLKTSITSAASTPWDVLSEYEDAGPAPNCSGGCAVPSNASAGFHAARAALRAATVACGTVHFDLLRTAPPLRNCSADELAAAVSAASRRATGAPLVVRGCSLQWYQGARACEVVRAVGGLDL